MSDTSFTIPSFWSALGYIWQEQRVWLVTALILLVLTVIDPLQGRESAVFAGNALLNTAPFLFLSIAVAAWANATGADNLIARAFTGAPLLMVILGALAGGLSPFCSCGVIPLIAALLAAGVPLAPASPPIGCATVRCFRTFCGTAWSRAVRSTCLRKTRRWCGHSGAKQSAGNCSTKRHSPAASSCSNG